MRPLCGCQKTQQGREGGPAVARKATHQPNLTQRSHLKPSAKTENNSELMLLQSYMYIIYIIYHTST